ncbi:MAG: NAD(P)-dependent glycerol-3-phosphate dehydrogenase [Betaproteobacteria bacterium]|nr:NAD(P)-dependent glycerol-3-phosphate dehydrogenase [Betaproteobacteria bacterium]
MPIVVIGAGAWGTAVAVQLAGRTQQGCVNLWARDAQLIRALKQDQENRRYLPGIRLPQQLGLASDLAQVYDLWRKQVQAHRQSQPQQSLHGVVILATPVSGLEEAATSLMQHLGPAQPGEAIIWLAKGLALGDAAQAQSTADLKWPHEIVQRCCPGWPAAALSGPSFAQEVARGLPAALSVASQQLQWARAIAQSCHGGGLRLYPTDDLIGVELGGAMKNVLAIAAGVCDGLALGANARAALLTRGLAEMSRLGHSIGARPQTFMGLACLGDLLLTATGDLSRNRRVGLALARGEPLADIVRQLGHVAEGVSSAPALLALAERAGVDVPITATVCKLIAGQWSAKQAIVALMDRNMRDEFEG